MSLRTAAEIAAEGKYRARHVKPMTRTAAQREQFAALCREWDAKTARAASNAPGGCNHQASFTLK